MVMEAAVSGGDRPRWWWGVMRARVLRSLRERKGCREVARAHMRGGNGNRWSGEEDDQARPTCRREGAAGWLGRPAGRLRPSRGERKVAQRKRRGDGLGADGSPEGGEERAGRPG
jgi:hypothetical protein